MPAYVRLLTLLLLAACTSPEQRTAWLLDQRLERQLAPDIAANRAVVQKAPDGARVTLLDTSIFSNDVNVLDSRTIDTRAGVIAALLDPDLMQVQVTDTSSLSEYQRDVRVRNVEGYFMENGVGSVLRPAEPMQTATQGPAGLTINISVVCPHRHDSAGYDIGQRKPNCF